MMNRKRNEVGKRTIASFACGQKGGTLLSITLVIVALSLMTTATYMLYDSSITRMSPMRAGLEGVLAADNLRKPVIAKIGAMIDENSQVTAAEIEAALPAAINEVMLPGYELGSLAVSSLIDIPHSDIPMGPYQGIPAIQKEVTVSYEIVRTDSRDLDETSSSVTLVVNYARISPLQFAQFWDKPFTELYWGGGTTFGGRIHANGDLCVAGIFTGASQNLTIEDRITAQGRVMAGPDPRCRFKSSPAWDNFTVLRTPAGELYPFNRGEGSGSDWHTNGCTNCGNSNQRWKIYSMWFLEGQILDAAAGIDKIRYQPEPFASAQPGVDGALANPSSHQASNNDNLRFLVDPPRPADREAVRDLKLSNQADIRIIDGVWYLKNPSRVHDWPGLPIWSDHPGETRDKWNQPVGQAELRSRWGWTTMPRRYSPYRYNHTSQTLEPSQQGALFYGRALHHATASPYKILPTFNTNRCDTNPLPDDKWCPDPRTPGTYGSSLIPGCHSETPNSTITCQWTGGVPNRPIPLAAKFLLATRQGFRDENYVPPASPSPNRGNILPANLSLKRLAEALNDTTPGELGSYFGATGLMGRDFNGILYISMSWPGSDTGFGGPIDPQLVQAPMQGNAADADQLPAARTGLEQQALPFQLCSDSLAGASFDHDTVGSSPLVRFRVPACNRYGRGPGQIQSYANSIRLAETADLRPFGSQGLTIASNIPVYVDSGFNSVGWVPAMVAADQVLFTHGQATDRLNWNLGGDSPDPGSQIWNLAVIGGWNTDPNRPGRSNSLPGRIDGWAEWRGNEIHFTGSAVMGFNPVYYRTGHADTGTSPSFYRHEARFHNPDQRPPGAPEFWVGTLKQWQRH